MPWAGLEDLACEDLQQDVSSLYVYEDAIANDLQVGLLGHVVLEEGEDVAVAAPPQHRKDLVAPPLQLLLQLA